MSRPWNFRQRASTVLLATSPALTLQAQPILTQIPNLPGNTNMSCHGLSADGSTVIGVSSGSSLAGFRWTLAQGMENLGPVTANGVSADGSVVVGTQNNVAFRWTKEGGFLYIPPLVSGSSQAHGVSADGSILTGYATWPDMFTRAFRWTSATGLQNLGALPNFGIQASYGETISADGSTVSGHCEGLEFDPRAFRWTQATGVKELPTLNNSGWAYGIAVSADGGIVVGRSGDFGLMRAVRWTGLGQPEDLGLALPFPQHWSSQANAVSYDGAVIGGLSSGQDTRAFLWHASIGIVEFRAYLAQLGVNVDGWELVSVDGISGDGSAFAGAGRFNGEKCAWIVTGLPVFTCQADCDESGALNIDDFICFQTLFATGSIFADCDYDGKLTIDDFVCFQTKFAVGC